MPRFGGVEDRDAIEAEMPYARRDLPRTLYQALTRTRDLHPQRPAIGFQLFSAPGAPARNLTWTELHERVTETANLFRSLGIGPGDVVAYLLPNCLEAPVVLGASADGYVSPGAGGESTTIRLRDITSVNPGSFSGAALSAIAKSIVKSLQDQGLASIIVQLHPDDINAETGDFDADGMGIHIDDTAPIGLPGMPGAAQGVT